MTFAQIYGIVVLALGAWLALAGSRHVMRGDLFSGTLGGGAAMGMILLATIVR